MRFSTTDRMGRRKEGVRTLTSGHAHQLPFAVFGLGQTPSLVERLEASVYHDVLKTNLVLKCCPVQVGVEGGGVAASRQWTGLVPNSQVIVIPSPPSQPLRYLVPSLLLLRIEWFNSQISICTLFPHAMLMLIISKTGPFFNYLSVHVNNLVTR